MADFVDEAPQAPRAAPQHSMTPVAEDFTENVPTQFKPGERQGDDSLYEGEYGNRVLPESTSKLIDQMLETPADPDDIPDDTKPVEVAPADAAPVDSAKPADATPPPAEWKAQLDTAVAERERMEAANKQLLADLEAAKKPAEIPAAHKLLTEAGNGYLESEIDSIRKLIAAGHGIDDPNHADVTAELAALTNVLTAHVFNVPLDVAQQASRDAARARQLLARDKRERKAESDQNAQREQADAEARKADTVASYIGTKVQSKDYPLLTSLAQDLDGISPGHVIWQAIERGKKLGHVDPAKMSDDDLISYGAKTVETYYKALADKIVKATQPSTATTEQPAKKPDATGSASNDQRQSHGARTLTQAAASVAPATPPAVKTKTATNRLPSRKEVLDKHFGD